LWDIYSPSTCLEEILAQKEINDNPELKKLILKNEEYISAKSILPTLKIRLKEAKASKPSAKAR